MLSYCLPTQFFPPTARVSLCQLPQLSVHGATHEELHFLCLIFSTICKCFRYYLSSLSFGAFLLMYFWFLNASDFIQDSTFTFTKPQAFFPTGGLCLGVRNFRLLWKEKYSSAPPCLRLSILLCRCLSNDWKGVYGIDFVLPIELAFHKFSSPLVIFRSYSFLCLLIL